MSENDAPNESGAPSETDGGIQSLDDALKVIKDLRAENAKRRVQTREEETRLREFEAWKESQLSDLEREKQRAERAEADRIAAYREAAAARFSVPEHLASRIMGSTREEIFADAESLGVKPQPDGAAPAGRELFGGRVGKPVSSKGDPDDILRRRLMGG